MNRKYIAFSVDFYIVYALMLLLLPLRWVICWIVAAFIHELSHILALKICKCKINYIYIRATGAVIRAQSLSPLQNIFASLSGPLGGFCTLLLAKQWPHLALCGVWQSVYNILPLNGLDGGKALQQCLQLILGEDLSIRIQSGIHYIVLVAVCVLGFWTSFIRQFDPIPIAISVLILLRNRKTPCKEPLQAVQ